MKWDTLTMSQKQALMKIYVNNGITNLDEIRNHYNRFDDGGGFSLMPTLEDIKANALSRIGNGLPSNNQSLYDATINKVNSNIRDVQNLGPAVQQAAEAQRQKKLDDLYNAKLMGKSLSTAASIMGVSSALSPLSNITVTNTNQAVDALVDIAADNSKKGLVRKTGKLYSSIKPFL